MTLYENIFKRKSIRKYSEEKFSAEVIYKINNFMRNLPVLSENLSLNAHFIFDGNLIYDKLNIIGRVKAPHYIVITGKRNRNTLINAGYAIEHLVLYLTSIGISTCYIGLKINNSKLSSILQITENEETLITIALGNAENPTSMYRKENEFNRLPLKNLVISGYASEGIRNILEAVRLSPSAQNSQPWRFVVDTDMLKVYKNKLSFIKRNILNDISYVDMGIGLCHLKLALAESGLDYSIEKHIREDETESENELIATITINKNRKAN